MTPTLDVHCGNVLLQRNADGKRGVQQSPLCRMRQQHDYQPSSVSHAGVCCVALRSAWWMPPGSQQCSCHCLVGDQAGN